MTATHDGQGATFVGNLHYDGTQEDLDAARACRSTLTLTDFLLARVAEDEAYLQDPWLEDDGPLHRSRMLAECETKRQIVAIHSGEHECWCVDYGSLGSWYGTNCDTLRTLALPYADHSDYPLAHDAKMRAAFERIKVRDADLLRRLAKGD